MGLSANFAAAAPPVITGSTLPANIYAGDPAFRFTIDGSGFVSGSVVSWNGTNLATTVLSATRLEATVPGALIEAPGTVQVKVVNPDGTASGVLTAQIVAVTLEAIWPSSAAAGSMGFDLRATGRFEFGTVLRWNGVPMSMRGLPNGFQLYAAVYANMIAVPGTVTITAMSPSGVVSRPLTFEITSAPLITTPAIGDLMVGDPGFAFTLTGANFKPGATILWGGTALPTTYISATQLRSAVTAGMLTTAGVVMLKVVNPDRLESFPLEVEIRALRIQSISPASARAGGPAFYLNISGTYKTTTVVYWNDTPLATTFGPWLSAMVPANLIAGPGTATITIVNPSGARSEPVPFTIASSAPTLNGTNISQLMAGDAGFTFQLGGSNFTPSSVVRWNAKALPTTYISDGMLTATVSSELLTQAGPAKITVLNSSGSESNAVTVQVEPLTLSSISPASKAAGSEGFTLTATGAFKTPVTVVWNATPLTTVTIQPRTVTAVVPASLLVSPGTASVSVSRGGVTTPPQTFTITSVAPPRIQSLSATQFAATMFPNGARLQVAGEGFRQGAVVKWDSTPLATTFESETSLAAMIPDSLLRTAASALVKVVNANGQESNGISVAVVVPTPILTRVTPQSVPAGGPSFQLTISGAGFYTGARVRWNGEALETVLAGSTEARAIVPASRITTAGTAQVSVANTPDGPFSNAATLTIAAATESLSIARLIPNAANALIPEFPLKITGAGFVPGSIIRWNNVPLATTFANSTELNAVLPPSVNTTPGSVSVVVVNPDGKQSNPASYTVLPAVPTITSMTPSSLMWGAPPFLLEVRGHGFAPGAIIRWGSESLLTRYLGYDRLTAGVGGGGIASEVRVSVVNPEGTTSLPQGFLFLPWRFAGCSPASVVAGGPSFALTATGENFQRGAVIRWSGTSLETAFVDSTTLVATVPASLIASPGDAPVTVVQPDGAMSSISVTVRAGGSSTITIAQGGIVNAANWQPSIAPGSLISIYASNLPARNSFAESTPLPTELNGVSVLVNGVRAPLLFAGGSQVNAQVPFEISPGQATVVVNAGTASSEPSRVEVKATGPGIFQMPSDGHAVAQNAADYSLNSAEYPARAGEYVILYVVGQGRLEPPVPTGAAAPGSPLSFPVAPVSATIGGRPAAVAFAGLAPGMVGVLQVNLRVPEGVSGEVPVEITIGGQTSPAAGLSVVGN